VGENRNVYSVLLGKPARKSFGTLRCRWENGMKMDLK
jgi:hypothetical protein